MSKGDATVDNTMQTAQHDLWLHLTSDRQSWLLGAGISAKAGVPLMRPLTDLVQSLISQEQGPESEILRHIRAQLPQDSHIEHVLSQLGDLIAIAERTTYGRVPLGGEQPDADAATLRELHGAILNRIALSVRYGYRPSQGSVEARVGSRDDPLVRVDDHRRFLRALFSARTKPGRQPPPTMFFTTNYDTLLEDALALEAIPFRDGFVGGAVGYWALGTTYEDAEQHPAVRATLVKLHGSIDWFTSEDGTVLRCRDTTTYNPDGARLLIYPQATKYAATQKDPFATLLRTFRTRLALKPDNVLLICGYSFGDEHINLEISECMNQPGSNTVVVAFCAEAASGSEHSLPPCLHDWLATREWRHRVFVATDHGLYHGDTRNLCPNGTSLDWWTFQGLTRYLSDGPVPHSC